MKKLYLLLLALLCILLAASEYDRQTVRRELAALRASLYATRTIVRACDGDTLELDGKERVRILGINTPEIWEKTKKGGWRKIDTPDPHATAAHEYLRSLEGCTVRVTFGKEKRDRFGRTLAHVYLLPDGPDLAMHILRQGWADVCAIPPNTARYQEWKTARQPTRQAVATPHE